jgi:hypothetical protein
MVMIGQSLRIFGLIAKNGSPSLFVGMVIKAAITNLHQEEVKQERKAEKVVMNDL